MLAGAAADVTAWCEFHNGVAAGLKVAPRRNRANVKQQHMQGGDTGGGAVQDAWLPHSKRTVPNYGHAGVLLGLGLQGHLDRLSWTDLYRYVILSTGMTLLQDSWQVFACLSPI